MRPPIDDIAACRLYLRMEGMDLEDADRRLRRSVSRIPATDREYMLKVLTSDDATRAEAIGHLHATGLVPATVELLIDAEAEPAPRALLVGILRETWTPRRSRED